MALNSSFDGALPVFVGLINDGELGLVRGHGDEARKQHLEDAVGFWNWGIRRKTAAFGGDKRKATPTP